MLSHASFFSGIGGFDLGLEQAGVRTVLQCEKNPFCQSVLERHWPDTNKFDDIQSIVSSQLPVADIWSGGFPCQDVSLARGNHKRPGFNGKNSSLFFPFFELIRKELPKVILLENVSGLLSSNEGQDFFEILRCLTGINYNVSWRVLNSRYLGSPQTRKRVYVCAWRGSILAAIRSLHEDFLVQARENPKLAFDEVHICKETGAIVPRISYCISATSGRHTGNDWSRTYISYEDRVRRPTPEESERLQGFDAGWTFPLDSYRIPLRGLDSERYRSIGNAVSVPAVKWISSRVIEQARINPSGELVEDFDFDAVTLLSSLIPNACNKRKFRLRAEGKGDVVFLGRKWQDGGCATGNEAIDFKCPEWTTHVHSPKFVDLIEKKAVDEKYFISQNAARGMLRRARELGRRFFSPMENALIKLSESHMISGDVICDPQLRSRRISSNTACSRKC